MHLSIIYEANSSLSQETNDRQLPYKLINYSDRNYAGDLKDWKSVMGHYFFINGEVLLWYSKKQQIISNSTIEAKYIALGHVT